MTTMANRSGYGLGAILIILGGYILVFGASDSEGAITPRHDKVVVCYYSSWAVYRLEKGTFGFKELRVKHCTHLVYAFAGLNGTTWSIQSLDPWGDLEDGGGKAGYKKATDLRNGHPGLKVTLAIGGWNEGSKNFSAMAASPERRRTFVNSAVAFVRKHNFDGLDLDWEFPAQRGGAPYDKENFVALAKDLSSAFKSKGLLLTAALGAGIATMKEAYDIPQLSPYLDYIHVMAYDYHGSWNQRVLPNAPLRHAPDLLTAEDSVRYLLEQGAPANKLVLGLPMYGRTFILTGTSGSPTSSPLGAEALATGFSGPFTKENGFMGYNEICRELGNKTHAWSRGWDDASSTAWAVREDRVISYDDPRTMMTKADFVIEENLAGVMVWSIDTDDFLADCAELHGEFLDPLTGLDYPLMRSINIALARAPKHEDNSLPDQIVPKSAGDATSWSSPSLIAGMSLLAAELYLRDRPI